MTVLQFYEMLDSLYPSTLSCDWDNDGIMCADDVNREVSRVLVSLDPTEEAIEYALSNKFDLLLTHHPLIFSKIPSVTDCDLIGKRIIAAIKGGLSVISLHTRLDAGENGVNDCLIEKLGFVPSGGIMDNESHSLGRLFEIGYKMKADDFALMCKEKLGTQSVRVTGEGYVECVAVVGGAGKDCIEGAITVGADALLTGECSYNSAQDAAQSGLIVVEAGHYHTEFPVCKRLSDVAISAGAHAEIYDSCMHRSF